MATKGRPQWWSRYLLNKYWGGRTGKETHCRECGCGLYSGDEVSGAAERGLCTECVEDDGDDNGGLWGVEDAIEDYQE